MLTKIMTVQTKVDLPSDAIERSTSGVLMVTADVRIEYNRPQDPEILLKFKPSIINFDASDILLSELIYMDSMYETSGYIEEESLTTIERAMVYVAVEATALDFIQLKIDEYIK